MFVSIDILVVFGVVVAGYLMERRNLRVLLQPAELRKPGGPGSRIRRSTSTQARYARRPFQREAGR
jgi:hypothetical protein